MTKTSLLDSESDFEEVLTERIGKFTEDFIANEMTILDMKKEVLVLLYQWARFIKYRREYFPEKVKLPKLSIANIPEIGPAIKCSFKVPNFHSYYFEIGNDILIFERQKNPKLKQEERVWEYKA